MFKSLARQLNRVLLATVLTLSVALVATACGGGGGDDGGGNGGGGNGGGNGGGGNGGGAEPITFDVSMGEGGADGGAAVNFFEPNEFSVSPGQQVTFNLTNDGAAIHNMRIAGPDGEYNTGDDAVGEPAQFLGGDTGTLVWTAPDAPGTVDFRCDFHPTDMIGTITVSE